MTKQEFIDQVAGQDRAVEEGRDGGGRGRARDDRDTLQSGGDISFTGFGKFHVAERGARQGVNPRTRERITIPGGKVPRFTAGSALKQAVKGG